MFPLNVLCCPLEHCAVQKCVPWKIFATGLQRACMMMIVVQKKKIPWKVFFPHLHYACIMIVQFRDIFLTSVTRSQDICMALTAWFKIICHVNDFQIWVQVVQIYEQMYECSFSLTLILDIFTVSVYRHNFDDLTGLWWKSVQKKVIEHIQLVRNWIVTSWQLQRVTSGGISQYIFQTVVNSQTILLVRTTNKSS